MPGTRLGVWARCVMTACLLAGLGLLSHPPAHAAAPDALAHDADLYLVPIGPVPAPVLQALAARYRELAGLKVEMTAELPLPDWTVDPARRQLIAEQAHALMTRIFEPRKTKAWAAVVAVSAHDMYIAHTTWRFAYAYGEGRYALVSAARMADAESTPERWSPRLMARLTRMLDKRLAVQYFGYGAALPAPEVLTRPILSLDDLDGLDAAALADALRAAAGPARRAPAEAPAAAPVRDDESDALPVWAVAAMVGVAVTLVMGLALLAYRQARTATGALRRQAQARGWRFGEEATRWYQPSRCFVEGEEAGVPFRLDWFQVGQGRSARRKTLWVCETGADLEMSVVPSAGLWAGLRARGRQKSGDAHYDCRFLAQGASGPLPALPAALRALHLEMPAAVHLHDGLLEVVHDGHAGPAETDRLVRLGLAWLGYARGQAPAGRVGSAAAQGSMWDRAGCALSRAFAPLFWLLVGGALLVFFGFISEEGNLPWAIAAQRVMPFALAAWLGWLLWRWRTRYHPGGRVGETVLSVLFLGLFWLMSGAWVLGWNALVGEQREVLVVGPVTDKRTWHDKQGEHHALTLADIESYRPVEVNTDPATYDRVRLGDPVGFELTRGSLGIYYRARWRQGPVGLIDPAP